MTKYADVLGGGFREASDDYLPSGYVLEDCEHIIKMHFKNAWMCLDCGVVEKICPHGVYKLAKVDNRWEIVCARCNSTHISPDELDEITDWMHSLCRGA